jgi:hypothetical protein
MTDVKKTSTRRAFFLNGGAVLGAGVAATAVAAGLAVPSAAGVAASADSGAGSRGTAEDREAIRQVHLAFVARLENQSDAVAGHLFDEPTQMSAYRQTTSQHNDAVTFSEDGLRATATFHCEVELCTPLEGDSTIAQMARLQGHVSTRRWESGRFDASYVKARGQWQMESVSYARDGEAVQLSRLFAKNSDN